MNKKASTFLTLLITGIFFLSVATTAIYRYYTQGVYKEQTPYYSYDGKFNINTATPAMLDELPGIGTALSQRIVSYREEHGPYKRINDLTKVHGIGPGTMKKIMDYITTGESK